jgi:hypothetical protein
MPASSDRKTQREPQQAALRRTPPETSKQPAPSGDDLRRRIAEAAYFRAEQRGFSPGCEVEDWLAAETEVMTSLGRAGVTH